MKKYLILITVGVFLATTTFTGCAKKAESTDEKKTVVKFATFYKDKEQADAYIDIAKEFEKVNKDAKIEIVTNFSDEKKVKDALTKNAEYDLIGLKRNQLVEYSKSGYLTDLTNFSSEKDLSRKLYNISTAYGKYNGKLYGVGDLPMTIEWFYNADLFKQFNIAEPKNLKELKTACEKLKKNKIIPISVGAMDSWTLTSLFGMITSQTAGSEKISVNYDSDSNAFEEIKGIDDAYKIFGKLIGSCIPINSLDINYKQSVEDFVKGKAAILPAGSWVTDLIEESRSSNFNYQVFQTPLKLTDKPVSEVSATSGQIVVVPTSAKNKEMALKFLDFIFSDVAQRIYADKGYASSLKSINNSGNEIKRRILDHLDMTDDNSIMLIENLKPQLSEAFASVLTDMLSGVVSADTAFKRTLKIAFHK